MKKDIFKLGFEIFKFIGLAALIVGLVALIITK